jgi:hypothetical protein
VVKAFTSLLELEPAVCREGPVNTALWTACNDKTAVVLLERIEQVSLLSSLHVDALGC